MEWRVIKHTESTDGKTENIHLELWINFPVSRWNQNEKSPIIEIKYHDRKIEDGWWLDNAKTKWYTSYPRKTCSIRFNYLQRQPDVVLYSDVNNEPSYENFDIDYCRERAIKIFSNRLFDILDQIKINEQ